MHNEQQEWIARIEAALDGFAPKGQGEQETLYARLIESMRYSLLDGGKRIRPLLVLEFCGLCGGDREQAMPFACALEMVHTYSLIHDDLPCMDDDDLRRGRPSNHKAFDEATALLAGDALLTLAFETMLSPQTVSRVGAEAAARAAGILARAAGAHGMIGGQVIDLESEGRAVPLETLQIMDECKTGALIVAAARMGCVLAKASPEQEASAVQYARKIGLAFQIQDDILDVTGDTEALGKQVGSDQGNQKSTYVSLLGLEEARALVQKLTREAVQALDPFPDGEEKAGLVSLAGYLSQRRK